MWRTGEGSTGRLLQLCLGYFVFYVITGVTVKYFLGRPELGFPGMEGIEFLVYSTLGGTSLAVGVVLALRWFKSASIQTAQWGSLRFPREFLYIIPSGVCTAVVIPTTTLMYTLPISVMVAMVIMRASVIIISRAVDAVQIRQGILHKKVYVEENIGVVFALLAAGVQMFWVGEGGFDFIRSRAATSILGSYIVAYSIRIYIMNYYKNTRGKGVKLNNKWFFGIEQISASVTLILATLFVFHSPRIMGWDLTQIGLFRGAIIDPLPLWRQAVLAGMAFGMVAFFSVFLFMFKGRTATFAGLVNRLTSLIAGTTATLVFYFAFKGRFPVLQDWISLAFILIAVGFLSIAERKRVVELLAEHEIEAK
ncbi:MAG: hypothetical protein JSW03_00720 [Candidatus Eiseniibacteriota bacterium]|nr:MAG: hypothetical protein JSW03_00720 [Candidatus Eisenbacteria bacterium]